MSAGERAATRAAVNGAKGAEMLTKREHFAAMAMQGLLSENASGIGDGRNRDAIATDAVACADALLLALEGGK